MVARIHNSELHPDKIEEARRLWEESIIPTMKKQKGFKNVYVLTHAPSKRITTITIWESQADADAWGNSSHIREFAYQLQSAVRHMPSPELFDVSIAG